MKRFKRRKDGRFKAKSTEDRKVRSIRATDSAWESLGDLADSQNMSRADLVEQLIEDGKLDFIQGLEIVQAIAKTLNTRSDAIPPQDLANALNPDQELQPLQELAVRLKPVKDLVAYLNNVQVLVDKLEPVQQLARHIEPVKNLAEKLEPIQALAQQLEPLSRLDQLQDLGAQVDIIQAAARQIEMACHESDAEAVGPADSAVVNSNGSAHGADSVDEQQTLAIALQVLDRFLETKSLDPYLPVTQASQVNDPKARHPNPRKLTLQNSPELSQEVQLSEFRKWLMQKLQSS